MFGGAATAVVATSRFLEGERIFQGNSPEQASATGFVSTNTGWQIGPKILKVVDYTGNFVQGEKVSGEVSKASGIIDNLSIARGVLNIDSITQTLVDSSMMLVNHLRLSRRFKIVSSISHSLMLLHLRFLLQDGRSKY